MKKKLIALMFGGMLAVFTNAAVAEEPSVTWIGDSSGCTFYYRIIDAVVTEGLENCSMRYVYTADDPKEGVMRTAPSLRMYDLRMNIVCSIKTVDGVVFGGMCRTVEELRDIDSSLAQELVRRFDWLHQYVLTSERDSYPNYEELIIQAGQ